MNVPVLREVVPMVLDFCILECAPWSFKQDTNEDAMVVLNRVLQTFLLNHWNGIFPRMNSSHPPSSSTATTATQPLDRHFRQIMSLFAESFTHTASLTTFKRTLELLLELEEKRRVFHTVCLHPMISHEFSNVQLIFQQEMAPAFWQLLLTALMEGNVHTLEDEILAILFRMASK